MYKYITYMSVPMFVGIKASPKYVHIYSQTDMFNKFVTYIFICVSVYAHAARKW